MTLYLSASSIKDFLTCPQRFKYRTMASGSNIGTQEMAVGTVVHKLIEECWNNKTKWNTLKKELIKEHDFDSVGVDLINTCEKNFCNIFYPLLYKDDLIEHSFKIKLKEGVYLVGRMDRISKNRAIVIDWKTGYESYYTIKNDVQFIIYSYAFEKEFGRKPSTVACASLSDGKLLRYEYNKRNEETLFQNVIPQMIAQIKADIFYKSGVFHNACKNCSYVATCWDTEKDWR
jgi:CRISPR/Cas system-associated exonuclease Cas4 (RecB family)